MIVEDQQPVIDFLSDGRAYPGMSADTPVARIDTHSATVFLVGDRAFKLKRAVRYDYLDFSTLERRHRYCAAEVTLNRRTAPDLYLGVVPVTRDRDRRLHLGGGGEVVEWLVEMRRFADDLLFDRLAAQGRLAVEWMPTLARAIAHLHASAESCRECDGVAAMRWVVDGNARGFDEEGRGLFDAERVAHVIGASRATLARQAPLLARRAAEGCIRACHGDLHLRNIVLLDGRPVPFDAVEFNDAISRIDVLYDLAFLLMDLWRLDLHRHASALFNAYVTATFSRDTCAALALFPLFLSCRSAVRAKTSATASRLHHDARQAERLAATARAYLETAGRLLAPPPPVLVAIGGPSGAGKSTVAKAIAAHLGPCPGALILRSDVLRKRLAGVEETERLGADGYTAAMHERVYAEAGLWAAAALAAGQAVIVDAVFGRDEERRAVAAVAARAGVPFAGVWLEAPLDVLTSRVEARRGDASDATSAVVVQQVRRGMGDVPWLHVPAHESVTAVEARVRDVLAPHWRVL